MSESTTSAIGTVFFVTMISLWAADVPPFGTMEKVTYNMDCDRSKECKTADIFMYRQVFRPDPATLSVTSWVKDGSENITIFRDCAIQDKQNWVCDTRNFNGTYRPEMHDGHYVLNPIFSSTEQVSWYRWWWTRLLKLGDGK
jgi:hypothetical protein